MKGKRRSVNIGRLLLSLFLVVMVWYLGSFALEMGKIHRERAQTIRKNQERIQKEKAEIKDLKTEIKSSDTMDFVEQVARDELGMVKPREIIFVDKNKNSEKPKLNEEE